MHIEERLSTVLSEFARTLVTDFPIQGILDHLVRRIVDVLPISAAGVTLISPTTDPHLIAASDESAMRFEQLQTDLGKGPCLTAYESGAAVAVPDLRTENRFPQFSVRALEEGMVAVFTFPLRHGDRRLGALDLYRETAGALDERTMEVAQTLADVTTAYLLNAQDRADLKAASDLARSASLHDDLTGLPNRTLLVERLEHAVLRTRRSGKLVGVLFVDLDRFKRINDNFGHHVGDELLVAVAERVAALLRPGDTLARLAGDEFVILCDELDDSSQAKTVATRIEDALAEPFTMSSIEVRMTASVGIALTGGDRLASEQGPNRRGHLFAEQILREADVAMYQIKKSGGANHGLVDLRELRVDDRRLRLSNDLPRAGGRGELNLEYQPLVSTLTQSVVGAEALLRWAHPALGAIPPTVFIPLAEQTGLITEIGQAVLLRACQDRARWQAPAGTQLSVAVNVSPYQLMSTDFVRRVDEVLGATQTPPELLTLELTETALVQDSQRATVVLDELRELGVQLALDDFGTGTSSLSHLRDFPVNTVKIDRSFVDKLNADSTNRYIVEAVATLAHRLQVSVIAEGVETDEQYQSIVALGCDAYQGFHCSPSLPLTELNTLLRRPTQPPQLT